MDLIVFLFGLSMGSFLLVLAHRLPSGEDVLVSRSHCDSCKHVLQWYELIPLVSYAVQRGRCRRCKHTFSVLYPLSELFVGLVFLFAWRFFGQNFLEFALVLLLFSSGFVLFISDAIDQILPDSMVLLLGGASVVYTWMLYPNQIFISIATGIGAALFFWLFWYGSRGRAMGFGDVKLACALGILVGFPNIIVLLYVAFLTGAGVGVILMMRGKKGLKSKIAFGPFLLIGSVVASMWGQQIIAWWKGFV